SDENCSAHGRDDHEQSKRLPKHGPAQILNKPENDVKVFDPPETGWNLIEFFFCRHVRKFDSNVAIFSNTLERLGIFYQHPQVNWLPLQKKLAWQVLKSLRFRSHFKKR